MLLIPLRSFFLLVQGVLEGNGFGKKIVNEKAFGFSQNFVVVILLCMCKSLYGGGGGGGNLFYILRNISIGKS